MNNLKLIRKSLLTLAGLTSMAIFNPQIAEATTLVQLSLNEADLNNPSIRIADICPEFACKPQEIFFANNVNTPIITLRNNTEFTITGFSLNLLDNQDAIFEQPSSKIFQNITLSNNRREAVFTEGTLPISQAATFIINSGEKKVAFSAKLSGIRATTSEPHSLLGVLALAASGGTLIFKKKTKMSHG